MTWQTRYDFQEHLEGQVLSNDGVRVEDESYGEENQDGLSRKYL
ncbi:MAG: hypothetical protein ETSY1_04780 [Candidatus Entotheonella factor]|uniref:Uncharacterized protein n=1 Tax=Entotheonella factor TaxID=1429438 RepID=W4LW14_ENTF1|nr:MAG: hypothetical protein ETSY1_04780 [Candidatus Entotheonella factor]